jgi:hypothetical protein
MVNKHRRRKHSRLSGHQPQSSSSLQPSSKLEALRYYNGLPSAPVLVARTGTPWKVPDGPEAYLKIRDLRVVGNHPFKEVWEDNLALKLHTLLDSMRVKWTSTSVNYLKSDEAS